jgi:transcriptional regulator with XRE-family HTH domain
MKLSDLKTFEQVIEEERQDPDFRAEWDRLAFAREVANRVVAYRADNNLSQRDLAKLVGMTQPAIARLEVAEHEPSLATLAKLSKATGLTFLMKVSDGGVELTTGASAAQQIAALAATPGVATGVVQAALGSRLRA